ncbi:DNA-binding transcriptional LysR family regulator [Microbacterium resistens]|uniref:DNA-binding transcriptional LysR family regulator n=1 Tax=Microbacterium resistens TaxID=156977 RepID=A0ABU1SE75_9MICO|nr:LysR family transcriptional regulator [Microbacterium resistens]MDR6867899.1 DNA-binding transcriptional LysR family regulator [Microbacterium resistens]
MRDLDLLRTFLAVHRAGSLTAAAAELDLSQPAVSDRMARLEAELGEPLLVRSPRGVSLTPAGERLAARVAEPIDRLRDAWAPTAEVTGTVRIGGASDVVASRIVPALAPLAAGGIRLDFSLGLAPALLDDLAAGALDLVVSSIRPTVPALRSQGLIDEEFVLVGAPSLARTVDEARIRANPAEALAPLPLVVYDEELSIIRRYWRSQFGHRPANPVALVVPDLRAILAAVVAGAGIAAIPRYLAEPAILSGSVELLHRPEEPPINTLHLVIRAGTAITPATSAVIARLRDAARSWSVF